MKINERIFRRILREEALRELTRNNNRSANLGLTLSEVSALRAWSSRSSRLNEDAPGLAERAAVAAMESRLGRKIMIGLLKAIKFITGTDVLILRNIAVPVWKKAIDFVNDKFGINVPISAEGIANFVKFFMPGHYTGMIIDEFIALLSDMSDEEYQEMVKKSKDSAAAKERAADAEGEDTGGDSDNDNDDRNEPAATVVPKAVEKPSHNPSRGLPTDTVNERQIRDLVRKELVRFHR